MQDITMMPGGPVLANAPELWEYPSHFLIRYTLEKHRFAQVFSSVTPRSVLLFGVVADDAREAAGIERPDRLIALIRLSASVDPGRTIAEFEDEELVLRLLKNRDCDS
jgi:hypothetical protein